MFSFFLRKIGHQLIRLDPYYCPYSLYLEVGNLNLTFGFGIRLFTRNYTSKLPSCKTV